MGRGQCLACPWGSQEKALTLSRLLPSGPEVGADGLRTSRSPGITWARLHLAGREETTPEGSETLEGYSPETATGLTGPHAPTTFHHPQGLRPCQGGPGHRSPRRASPWLCGRHWGSRGKSRRGSVSRLLLRREGVRQSWEELCSGRRTFPQDSPEHSCDCLHVRSREGSLRPAV